MENKTKNIIPRTCFQDHEDEKCSIGIIGWDAARFGHLECLKKIIEKKQFYVNAVDPRNGKNYTALHWAARNGYYDCVELLLMYGADVFAKDIDGRCPAQWAPYTCVLSSLSNSSNAMTLYHFLHLKNTYFLDIEDKKGNTVISWILKYGDSACINILEEYTKKEISILLHDNTYLSLDVINMILSYYCIK